MRCCMNHCSALSVLLMLCDTSQLVLLPEHRDGCPWCRYRHGGQPEVTMYNYGSPRVGNAAFARAYDRSVPDSWRVTNRLDVIPRVPRLMGYCHVGNSVSVTPDGRFEVNGALQLSMHTCLCLKLMGLMHVYQYMVISRDDDDHDHRTDLQSGC